MQNSGEKLYSKYFYGRSETQNSGNIFNSECFYILKEDESVLNCMSTLTTFCQKKYEMSFSFSGIDI